MTFRGARDRRKAQPVPDHDHPDYWTERDHERFEDRVSQELGKLGARIDGVGVRVDSLATRMTLLLGALGLIAFLLPILAPFLRSWAGVDLPATVTSSPIPSL